MPAKLTQEEFIAKARAIHGDLYDYSQVKYVNYTTPVTIICQIHREFQQKPREHLSKKKCHKCDPSHKMTREEFIEKAQFVHGDRYDYSKVIYRGSKKKVIIICREHGDFEQQPTSHLAPTDCPKCGIIKRAKSRAKDAPYFIAKARLVHDDLYDYSKVNYVNRSTNVTITCREHGEFHQAPANHYQGKGCSKCNNSRGETLIEKFLTAKGINYETQKKFDTCRNIFKLPFDFYLPEYDVLIEFDGIQHFEARDRFEGVTGFENTKNNDLIKDKWVCQNGKTLLRIPYVELNMIDVYVPAFIDSLVEDVKNRVVSTAFEGYNNRDYIMI